MRSMWCCTHTKVKDDEQEQAQEHAPEGVKDSHGVLGPLLPKWAVNTHKSPSTKKRQILPVLSSGAAGRGQAMLLGQKLPALEDAERQMSETSDARSSHPFGVPANGVQRSLASQFGLRPFTVEALRDLNFPVYSPHNAPPGSRSLPVAMLGVETLEEQHVTKPSNLGHANVDPDLQPCRPSGPSTNSRLTNNLVPLHVNAACKAYFNVSNAEEYVGVVRKLLARDPLLAFAVQKALKHLRTGECKHVMHVTPDPSGQSSTLFGIRFTPCLWEGTGQLIQPALLVEHNMPYNAAEVMPRLMRDYAVLSHVPAILTLIDFQGKALYQNAASLAYMGDLLSTKHDFLSEGLLKVLFMYETMSLEAMLEEILHGQEWQGVIQVPGSIRRFLALHAEKVAADGRTLDDKNGQMGGAGEDLLEVDFQIGNSFSTKGLGGRHRKQLQKASATAFLANRGSVLNPQAPGGPPTGPPSRNASMHQHALAAAALPASTGSPAASAPIAALTPRHTNAALAGSLGPDSFTAQGATSSAPSGTDMPNQRRFMTLLDKTNSVPRSHHANARGSAESLHHCSSMAGSHEQASVAAVDTPVSTIEAPHMAVMSATSTHDASTRDGEGLGMGQQGNGDGDDEDEYYDDVAECYHELHAIPLLDPVLDKQVIMLVQTDVTPRVELENKLADLTDAQLNMIEQLWPRHIIEYMLAKHNDKQDRGKVRDLANTHEQVMVLFCDVVGFTSMSKEVEPSQVMHFLNELYEAFDELVDDYAMYKLDIVGDCYIVVAGLMHEDVDGFVCVDEMDSEEVVHNAERIMEFAKVMLRDSRRVLMPHNGTPVQLRVGIHTGPLVSGLVGSKMPKFTLFGDTMNTASRMESTCRPGCIHVSDAFAQLLPSEAWQSTGGVQVKGKGLMQTFLHVVPEQEPLPIQHSVEQRPTGGDIHLPPSISAARASINHTISMSRAMMVPNSPSIHTSMHDVGHKAASEHAILTVLSNLFGDGGGGGGPEGGGGSVRYGPLGVSMGRLRTHGGSVGGPRISADSSCNMLATADHIPPPDSTSLNASHRRRRPSEGPTQHHHDFTARAHRRSSHAYGRHGAVKRAQSMGSAAMRARLAASAMLGGGSTAASDRNSSQSGQSSLDSPQRQPTQDRSSCKQPASPLRHATGASQASNMASKLQSDAAQADQCQGSQAADHAAPDHDNAVASEESF